MIQTSVLVGCASILVLTGVDYYTAISKYTSVYTNGTVLAGCIGFCISFALFASILHTALNIICFSFMALQLCIGVLIISQQRFKFWSKEIVYSIAFIILSLFIAIASTDDTFASNTILLVVCCLIAFCIIGAARYIQSIPKIAVEQVQLQPQEFKDIM